MPTAFSISGTTKVKGGTVLNSSEMENHLQNAYTQHQAVWYHPGTIREFLQRILNVVCIICPELFL